MGNFRIKIKLGDNWHKTENVMVTGGAFVLGTFKSDGLLAAWFKATNWADFVERVKEANGFFAVVVTNGLECYAAVDRVRSIPLFYAINKSDFYLSDDPKWIQKQLGGKDIDPISVAEFLLTGYVTDEYTLDPRIRQLQAGEALRVRPEGDGFSFQAERYYRFITGKGEDETIPESQLLRKLDEVIVAAVERLTRVADGSLIVIPLSGGLDSRLIAMTLKRLGYKNIIAFSYGVKGNWESKISQKVANQLGIPWYFVEYSRDLWRKWYWSDECQQYIDYACKLVSLAHLQDWPAVMELRKNGVIPEGALIAPGHTGDFTAGGHIPSALTKKQTNRVDDVLRAIWQHHYVLMPVTIASKYARMNAHDTHRALFARLKAYFRDFPEAGLGAKQAIGLYETWEWAERQAKYIVNSVRVYDYFGLDWWMPWWDTEFIVFWERVPLEWRFARKLWRLYATRVAEKANIFVGSWNILAPMKNTVKAYLRQVDRYGLFERGYNLIRYLQGARSPGSTILALDGAFGLTSERRIKVSGAAALRQLQFLLEGRERLFN